MVKGILIFTDFLSYEYLSLRNPRIDFFCCCSQNNFATEVINNPVCNNHLTPNGHYMGRTAQLTSRCCILYIYSTNIRTEYFKHAT